MSKYLIFLNYYLFIFIAVMCSCQSTVEKELIKKEIPVTIDDLRQVDSIGIKKDSLELQPQTKSQNTNVIQMKPKPKPIEKEDFQDVFDDPNYIGTPCEDVNGICIRHKHH